MERISQGAVNQAKTEQKEEGYSTATKVAIGGIVVAGAALFWWCGGPAVATALYAKITAVNMTAAQIAAAKTAAANIGGGAALVVGGGKVVVDTITGEPKASSDDQPKMTLTNYAETQGAQGKKVSASFSVTPALSSSGVDLDDVARRALTGKENDSAGFKSPLDDFSLKDLERIGSRLSQAPSSTPKTEFYAQMGVSVPTSCGIGEALQFGKDVQTKVFSAENLTQAESVVRSWTPGQKVDPKLFRPLIEHICERDPLKKGTLLPKLEQMEAESSPPSVASRLGSAAIPLAGSIAGTLLSQGAMDLYRSAFGKSASSDTNFDEEVLSALRDDQCGNVVNVKAFCDLVENVFKRRPEKAVLLEGAFLKQLKKLVEKYPEQKELIPQKYKHLLK